MRGSVFVDLRNVYKPHEAAAAGLDYFGIGIGAVLVGTERREAAE
jgi:hypothetical protein